MKILILNSILYTAENNVIHQVETIKECMIYNLGLGFKSLGHEVTLVAAEEYKPTKKETYEIDIIFIKSNFKKLFLPSVFPLQLKLFSFLKKEKQNFDLIITSETFAFPSLFAAILCSQKTLIWQELTIHQNKFHQIPSKIWYKFILPLFMKNVRKIVPRSVNAGNFVKRYSNKVSDTIVDHGINVNKFISSKEKKRQIISSSRLVPGKNIDGIIRVFNKFTKLSGYEDVKLLIAGHGEELDNLKELVNTLNLNEKVNFLGYLNHSNLNIHIRESMVFLVDTQKDLNMISIPESIVSGTPILTNLLPASSSYIMANKLGIAKDNWSEYDIKEIIDDNTTFVENCIVYRDKLSNKHIASLLIDTFNSEV